MLYKSYAETCAKLLRRCTTTSSALPHLGCSLLAHAMHSGLLSDFFVSTKLLTLYSSLHLLEDRDGIFQESKAMESIPFSHDFMISELVKSSDTDGARKLFDEMPETSPVSWTVMIDGLMDVSRVREAVAMYHMCPCCTVCGFVSNGLYEKALESSLWDVGVVFTSVIKACTESGKFDFGGSILGLVVKTSFENNVYVRNSLIALFIRMGELVLAKRVFL